MHLSPQSIFPPGLLSHLFFLLAFSLLENSIKFTQLYHFRHLPHLALRTHFSLRFIFLYPEFSLKTLTSLHLHHGPLPPNQTATSVLLGDRSGLPSGFSAFTLFLLQSTRSRRDRPQKCRVEYVIYFLPRNSSIHSFLFYFFLKYSQLAKLC